MVNYYKNLSLRNRIITGSIIMMFATVTLFTGFIFFTNVQKQKQLDHELATTPSRIVASMTLEQKVGQLIHVGIPGKLPTNVILKEIKDYHFGGVILFAANMGSKDNLILLNKSLQKSALENDGIPLLISTDQEGGRVLRVVEGVTQFPGAMAMGQTDDAHLVHDAGFLTSTELDAQGINFLLAPSLDVNNNPENPVINTRSFGSDPERVAKLGVAYMKGVLASGGIPAVKHFPGHGNTNTDSHFDLPVVKQTLEELDQVELLPFKRAIANGTPVVMSAHILFPFVDPKSPATVSSLVLKNLLRERLNFKGVTISDAMEMDAISKRHPGGTAAVHAVQSGIDILLYTGFGKTSREAYHTLLNAVKKGEIPEDELNKIVERQIALKFHKGLFIKEDSRLSSSFSQLLKDHFEKTIQKNKDDHSKMLAKYHNRPEELNEFISEKSIRSLRKDFLGLTVRDKKQITIFYKSKEFADEALQLGVHKENLKFVPFPEQALMFLPFRKEDDIWIAEVSDGQGASWNVLVKSMDQYAVHVSKKKNANPDTPLEQKNPMLIGLYTGNPFHHLWIPEHGVLLCSFSSTATSKKYLMKRALQNQPVKQADIILKNFKSSSSTKVETTGDLPRASEVK